ncbi:MAG TPA: YceI family protein [Gammaproteobacteria bacterium]
MNRKPILVLAALAVVAAPALAEPRDYVFDMAHSRIFFEVDHRGFSTMVGRFADFGGTFRFDPDDPAASFLDVTIDPASVDMFHAGLNEHLKNADFFDVANYPELRFVSERVEVVGENRYAVHGRFTMLGQTHPLTLDVVLNKTGTTRSGAPMAGFSARGTLDRTQYGMTFAAPVVGTNVAFRIEIEASATDES